ncbi:hypothetical protein [Microbacterium sp. CFBP9034]|uniref:hypothetical protein n=1 Tax=Microbacterium sp. CFBP9034 TaxID=3096540 RepID=UPI002A6B7D08|nr:hypothetical protein [Microbacterium sp. CFBP9034]MDY0910449.1 hypothetical protein [Microbacterium sp. CFBP9034]
MKHVTFADKSLLTGDETADLLVEYCAVLARAGDADTVDIVAYTVTGDKVTAKMLLNTGAPLMAETAHTDLAEPDNDDVTAYMREQIALRMSPPNAQSIEPEMDREHDFGL